MRVTLGNSRPLIAALGFARAEFARDEAEVCLNLVGTRLRGDRRRPNDLGGQRHENRT